MRRLIYSDGTLVVSCETFADSSTFRYIVDGKTAGVIVFLWLWIFMAFYVVLKKPKMAIVFVFHSLCSRTCAN